MAEVQFSRVLLKLSGESLKGSRGHGIDPEALDYMAGEIKSVTKMGVELGIVVGGGNIWRGSEAETEGMDRATADYAGMLATVISALALQESMERKHNLDTRTMSAINIQQVAEPYIRRRAIRHLEKGRVVLLQTQAPLYAHWKWKRTSYSWRKMMWMAYMTRTLKLIRTQLDTNT